MTFAWNAVCPRVLAVGILLLSHAHGACGVSSARAGGGPENVFLVVNSNSWASMTVASHYVQWRRIPSNNLLYLPVNQSDEAVTVGAFRQYLLRVILSVIHGRGLSGQIDYIVYSSDFPTTVDVTSLLGGRKPPDDFKPVASLTGMTYFWPLVQANSAICLKLTANQYMRYDAVKDPRIAHSRGFRNWYGWGTNGELREAGGQHYMLSTMLAVTSGRGNSVREALGYLYRAASADGTRPAGTIYFAKTNDERTLRRDRNSPFQAAVSELRRLGVGAEIISRTLPRGKRDVAGAMIGSRRIAWSRSGSTILPGAICDNFNDLGGVFIDDPAYAVESPLSEFLRWGAAGACGTVIESNRFPQKFPTAKMHVHYARGCTLAEAVYQSVAGPYQLLVVGDPLCRPWATIPEILVTGLEPGATVKDTVSIRPAADGLVPVDRFQLFVDGILVEEVAGGEEFHLETRRIADGHHEIRVVGMENSPIESQGRAVIPIVVDNHGHSVQLDATPSDKIRWGETVEVNATAPGANRIELFFGSFQKTNLLGTISGETGKLAVTIEAERFGYGPLRLLAVAYYADGESERSAIAKPILLTVGPGPILPGRKLRAGTKLSAGLQLTRALGQRGTITATRDGQWLSHAGVRPGQQYSLSAVFNVPAADVYQFQIRQLGSVRIDIDGQTIFDADSERPSPRFVPVVLGAGLHRFVLQGRAGNPPLLDLRFGNRGATHVSGSVFQHPQ